MGKTRQRTKGRSGHKKPPSSTAAATGGGNGEEPSFRIMGAQGAVIGGKYFDGGSGSEAVKLSKVEAKQLKRRQRSEAVATVVWTCLAVAALGAVYAAVASVVNTAVSKPYMDEIFHIPQARQYLNGNYDKWDPKITTLPGTYIVSVAYCYLLQRLLGSALQPGQADCSKNTAALRSMNCVLSVVTVLVAVHLLRRLHPSMSRFRCWLYGLTVAALWPLQFFFAFLYYTDVAATLFVLLSYAASLNIFPSRVGALEAAALADARKKGPRLAKRVEATPLPAVASMVSMDPIRVMPRLASPKAWMWSMAAAVLGGIAILCRQTNAVWVAFIIGNAIVRGVQYRYSSRIIGSNPTLATVLRRALPRTLEFIVVLTPLITLIGAFAVFLVLNGGVVVGDRSNHEMVLHVPQLFYFAQVAMWCMAGDVLETGMANNVVQRLRWWWSSPGRAVVSSLALLAACYAIATQSHVHKFILADNRHYTFYMFKDVIKGRGWWLRFALLPAHVVAIAHIANRLGTWQTRAWTTVYCIAVVLVLVPAPLVEFRYFTLPLIMLLLHVPPTTSALLLSSVAFVIVNAMTLWVFVARPFTAPDGSTGRFMW